MMVKRKLGRFSTKSSCIIERDSERVYVAWSDELESSRDLQ